MRISSSSTDQKQNNLLICIDSHILKRHATQSARGKKPKLYEVVKLATLVKNLKNLSKILLFPFAIGLLAPAAVEAGGGDHKGHHDHHGGHMNMGDS